MSKTVAERRRVVASLISQATISSQDDLAECLVARGLHVTQATISRDLEAIGAVKIKRAGQLCYALPDELGDTDWAGDRLDAIIAEWVLGAEIAGNIVVIRARPGSAHVVGAAIDSARIPEIVGTIAGDDTLFVAVREAGHAGALCDRFRPG